MDYKHFLPNRPTTGHKGTFGRIGVLAGSDSMMGAAILCAKAAYRSGAGVVVVMTDKCGFGSLNNHIPEAITVGIDPNRDDVAVECVEATIADHQLRCLVIGPGLGRSESMRRVIRRVVSHRVTSKLPVVLDADALTALDPKTISELPEKSAVVTPHEGEFNRLFCNNIALDDRSRAAEEAARRLKQIVVLKGAGTVISDGHTTIVNPTGNAGMATAGSGDVLSGLIGALIGQGASVMDASVLGVYLHGLAGDRVKCRLGEHSVMASDILDELPDAILEVSQ